MTIVTIDLARFHLGIINYISEHLTEILQSTIRLRLLFFQVSEPRRIGLVGFNATRAKEQRSVTRVNGLGSNNEIESKSSTTSISTRSSNGERRR